MVNRTRHEKWRGIRHERKGHHRCRPDGNFGAYLASPASAHGPGVVVIQEIFGVNDVVRQICDYHAARAALRLRPICSGVWSPAFSSPTRPGRLGQRFGLMQRFDADKGVRHSGPHQPYAQGSGCSGKVGTVGYCLGGQLAFLSAPAPIRMPPSAITALTSEPPERSGQDQEAPDAAHRGQGHIPARSAESRSWTG
jgi:dienelactone hydrolase